MDNKPDKPQFGGPASYLVAAGIFLSRIAGLVRETIFAHFFGTSMAGDAFKAAFRIPNLLQNLFGEGVLSASFIPRYAVLLGKDDKEAANEVAGAVAGALAFVSATLVLIGVATAPYFVPAITDFHGEQLELTIRLTQILFPGAGLLVFSAWCLGILNSHRRFFLSYAAPVIWNVVMISTLFWFPQNAVMLAWGSVLGSALQFLIQLPSVLKLARGVRPHARFKGPDVRAVFRNFVPNFISRGVVQLSAFIDLSIATYIPVIGAMTALSYAQTLYTLPISLFGMSVSAAELPAMSSEVGRGGDIATALRLRINHSLQRIAFFIVPTVVAFLAFGGLISGAIFQSGEFKSSDTIWVWQILAGSTVGLLASTSARLYSSAYFATGDTRTPLNFAIVRVILTTALGYLFALTIPRYFAIDPKLGAAGLTLSAGMAGWVEFYFLRKGITAKIGKTGLGSSYFVKLSGAATIAASGAWLVDKSFDAPLRINAIVVLATYGVIYLVIARAVKVPEAQLLLRKIIRR